MDIHDVKQEIIKSSNKKSGTFMNIPSKQLKQTVDISSEPLKSIWNDEVIQNKLFPSILKLTHITPLFKTLWSKIIDL